MSPPHCVPAPPAFLDPLTEIEGSYYYAVPKFFGSNHPNTRWLIAMIKNNEDDRLKHKMETSPNAFQGVYYQMMDFPQLYIPEDIAALPMFKRQAVVYLSPVGMALYLCNSSVAELFLSYKDVYNHPLCDPKEPQYATHLQDIEVGDFHSFPPYVVMLRRSSFGCAQAMLKAGWDPSQPIAMPMRRKFERRVLYFRDWLEVVLAVLQARPMYALPSLLREMTKSVLYKPIQFRLERLVPIDPSNAEPFGLINVDEMPPGISMIGVRSLLDMAEHYDRYLQMRECAKQVAALKREAAAVGLNPEVLMIQAQDFDGGDPGMQQTDGSNAAIYDRGANNSSAAEDSATAGIRGQPRHVVLNVNMNASKKKDDSDPLYASEGCRILHFALMRDPHGKSMQLCLEAFTLLLRRGFYLQVAKPVPSSSLARDVRNTVSLVLNLLQREQKKVDKIVDKIKSGVKKFAHLEEHKQLENRKTACIQTMSKLVAILTKFLLQTKLLADFIQAEFPPYVPSSINFPLDPYLANKFQEIKFGVIREFNSCKDAWIYLDKEMLKIVGGIPEMQLHFKVGKVPIVPPKAASKNKNKSNMSNTNSCFVSYTRVQRRPKPKHIATSEAAAASSSSFSVSSALLGGDLNSEEACLVMESSAESIVSDTSANSPNLPDLPELPDLMDINMLFPETRTYANDFVMLPGALPQSTSTNTPSLTAMDNSQGTVKGTTDMEQLLASLCREVDSLFRPLEGASGNIEERPSTATEATRSVVGDSTIASEPGAATGHHEYSTIEPDLAPTPMPTPEASLSQVDVFASASGADQPQRLRRRSQQIPPGLRKKLKKSSVMRLFGRLSAKDDAEATIDSCGLN